MKRLLTVIAAGTVLFAGCSQGKTEESKSATPKKEVTLTVPKDFFRSDKVNQKISESEIKESIKQYLDSFKSLTGDEALIKKMSSMDASKEEQKKIHEMIQKSSENDKNFETYISKNNLPQEYKKETQRISDYIQGVNQSINKLDSFLDKKMDNGDFGVEDIKEIKEAIPSNVNGREQKKIEDFLKEKNIQTDAFQK